MSFSEKDFTASAMRIFKENGMGKLLNAEKCTKLYALTERLISENQKYNLTAITDMEGIILNHYCDSLTLSELLPHGAKIIVVGCGAGFPSLPLAIVREDLKILAVDSTAKRVNYVNESAKLLGISNIEAVFMRAEDGAKMPEYREKFDFATARAVAEMRVLSELTLPYVTLGGAFIAMKGKNAEYELSAAAKAISVLGGRVRETKNITLVNGTKEPLSHPLIIVEKKSKTSPLYPRAYAQISKKPL